jgi:hypothetical protein
MGIYPTFALDEHRRDIFNAFNFFHYYAEDSGLSCCSEYSFLSAHYMKPEQMIHLDLVLQLMQQKHFNGRIPRPSYSDILYEYSLLRTSLNISQRWEDQ